MTDWSDRTGMGRGDGRSALVAEQERAFGARDALDLLDWRRRIFALYGEIRVADDPHAAWQRWREVRDELYRSHPQSPVPPERRPTYRGSYFDYDPDFRVVAEVVQTDAVARSLDASTGGTFAFSRVALARFALLGRQLELELDWNDVYGGGVLVAIADDTSGVETYGGGRYVLDTVKGADLGPAGAGLVLDFNFAYNPSCAYDRRWSCPLAPPANRLGLAISVGERSP